MDKPSQKKNIVIVGGGFGGLRAALNLEKYLRRNKRLKKQYKIILLDKKNYHLFTPSIYEVATTAKNDAAAIKLKKAVTIAYEKILAGKKIAFVQDAALNINRQQKQISLKDAFPINFEYLVVAVGAQINYYNIKGLKENSCTLKTLESAIHLRNTLANTFLNIQKKHRSLRIVIGGGGIGGVELAGEVTGYLEKLAKQSKSLPKWHITIIQAHSTILPNFSAQIIKRAEQRLKKLGVEIVTEERISNVTENTVETKRGQKFPYDVLFWAGGIKPSRLTEELNFKKDERGRLTVNKSFCPYDKENKLCEEIFVIGDSCCFLASGKPLPATSWSAINQGEHIAKVIIEKIKGRTPPIFHALSRRYVLPIKGKYAIAEIFGFVMAGPHIWALKELIYLRYLLQIIPFWQAITKWTNATWLFAKND